jgi:cysteine desulfuration protein SufE
VDAAIPGPLAELIEDFRGLDRRERAEQLIDWADQFEEVPAAIATRPFPAANHVARCESEAFVWAIDRPDGTQSYHFAVENPQGLSAKAWAAIMQSTLSGQPLEQVVAVSPEAIFEVFGRDLSMGKGQGLIGMLDHVTHAAKRKLRERSTR